MSSRTISLIIPTRDRPAFLRQAVVSALSQTLPPQEIIVVDDGSRPEHHGDLQRIAGLSSCILLERFAVNRGRSVARNHGLALATGQYIHFLDDDDLLQPIFYEKMTAALEKDNRVDIAFCEARFFHNQLEAPVPRWFLPILDRHGCIPDPVGYVLREPLAINSCLFRRRVAAAARFPEHLSMGEDTVYLINFALSGACLRGVPGVEVFVRIHAGNTKVSASTMAERDRFVEDLLEMESLQGRRDHFILILQQIQNGWRGQRQIRWRLCPDLLRHPFGLIDFLGHFGRRKFKQALNLLVMDTYPKLHALTTNFQQWRPNGRDNGNAT